MKMAAGTMGESRQLPKTVGGRKGKKTGDTLCGEGYRSIGPVWQQNFGMTLPPCFTSHTCFVRANSLLAQQEVSYYKTDCLILGSLCSATTLFLCLLLPEYPFFQSQKRHYAPLSLPMGPAISIRDSFHLEELVPVVDS